MLCLDSNSRCLRKKRERNGKEEKEEKSRTLATRDSKERTLIITVNNVNSERKKKRTKKWEEDHSVSFATPREEFTSLEEQAVERLKKKKEEIGHSHFWDRFC